MINALDINASALVAQRTRLNVISGNIANADATIQEDGVNEPYRRRIVTFAAGRANEAGPGVHVDEVLEDPSEFRLVPDPGHPHAIQDGPRKGMVRYPNVSTTMEYIDAIEASRAYEANLAMMNLSRGMIQQTIQLFA